MNNPTDCDGSVDGLVAMVAAGPAEFARRYGTAPKCFQHLARPSYGPWRL